MVRALCGGATLGARRAPSFSPGAHPPCPRSSPAHRARTGVVAASGLWLFALYACGLSVTVLRVSRWYNFFIVGNLEVAKPSELRDYDEVDDHEDDDSDQRGKRST